MKAVDYLQYFIAVVVILLASCSNPKQMSPREESLFAQEYHDTQLPIDSFQTLGEMLQYIDNNYCPDNDKLWPTLFFDFKTKSLVAQPNKHTLKIGLDPSPCIQGKFDHRMILEIIKDGYNTEIEQIFTELDSIPYFINKQMLSMGEDPNYSIGALGNGIWLCSKKADLLVNLNEYIYQIIVGYLSAARKYSDMAYRKSIDELDENEFAEFSNEFRFHLSFKYTDEDPKIQLNF